MHLAVFESALDSEPYILDVYIDVSPTSDDLGAPCGCLPKNENCSLECKNRLARIECSTDTCPNGARWVGKVLKAYKARVIAGEKSKNSFQHFKSWNLRALNLFKKPYRYIVSLMLSANV